MEPAWVYLSEPWLGPRSEPALGYRSETAWVYQSGPPSEPQLGTAWVGVPDPEPFEEDDDYDDDPPPGVKSEEGTQIAAAAEAVVEGPPPWRVRRVEAVNESLEEGLVEAPLVRGGYHDVR